MRVFIDGIQLIRVESMAYIYHISLLGKDLFWSHNGDKGQYFTANEPIDLEKADHIWVNHQRYDLSIGIVTLTKEFDEKYRYDGVLGYQYHTDYTTFSFFSPVVKEAYVVIEGVSYPMSYIQPIWYAKVDGNLEGKRYYYQIRLEQHLNKVLDPYGKAIIDDCNVIIDFNKTYAIQYPAIHQESYLDAVIYEGHIKDLTYDLDIEYKGVFEGLYTHSKKLNGTVLTYIKRLGMTHLQLLPVYDFIGVDAVNKDVHYNWGYNPNHYFALSNWYNLHPNDPYHGINRFKELVSRAHRLKLGIVLDVVFNHVYQHWDFTFEKLVPGYFFRHDDQHQMSDHSFVGNDIETRRYMTKKFIIDNLVFLLKTYQVDGFRFDLMGLLDIDLMKDIEVALKEINPSVMLYGEGWNMESLVDSKKRSNQANADKLPYYAFFNDRYRDSMRGSLHGEDEGFLTSNQNERTAIHQVLCKDQHFLLPQQSIQYLSCHDNYTLYDRLVKSGIHLDVIQYYQDLGNHLLAISQGIPFYQAGQEVYLSKQGVENAYQSSIDINKVIYKPSSEAVKKLKTVLAIRKKYQAYRQPIKKQYQRFSHYDVYTIEDKNIKLIHYIKRDFILSKIRETNEMIFNSQKVFKENQTTYLVLPGIYIFIAYK